ncbi:MAG: undecaprenyl-phosphate glucose phosphotransferase [bacterium]
MRSQTSRLVSEAALVALDLALVALSFFLAYAIRFQSGLMDAPKGTPPFAAYIPGVAVASILFIVVFRAHDLYRPRRARSTLDEAATTLRAVGVATLLAMAAAFLYRGFSYSRLSFLLAWGVASALLPAGRILFREVQRALHRRGVGIVRVAIIGAGEMGAHLARKIASHPELGFELAGFIVDDDARADPRIDAPNVAPSDAPIAANTQTPAPDPSPAFAAAALPAPLLGSLADAPRLVERESLDRLFVALPLASHHRMLEIVAACDRLPVEIQFVPDLFEIMTQRVRISEIDGIPLLAIRSYPLEAWNRAAKRTFDIVLSTLFLAACSPIMLLAAILVRLDSRGPVLYRQRRIGRDGREFTILKFRSMPVDAEQNSGPVIGDAADPRATRLGRFLRRTCIDELPQLWNVLVGQMSLVGPRPERPVFVEQFDREVPRYFSRHRVKSGVTGWAQVNGLRGKTSIAERTKYDIFYVENWSVVFDMKILLLTARQVIFANRPR